MISFTLAEFYTKPAIPLNQSSFKSVYATETINFDLNSHGYRTYEFDNVQEHIVIAGCSHTEGYGLHANQTWAKKFESRIGIKVFNLAKMCASADFVNQNLQNWISVYKPKLVIAQWPNPFRCISWQNGTSVFNLNRSPTNNVYRAKILDGDENFYQPWCSNILSLNKSCQEQNIPIVNMCLETNEVVNPVLSILENYKIKLHYDEKFLTELGSSTEVRMITFITVNGATIDGQIDY